MTDPQFQQQQIVDLSTELSQIMSRITQLHEEQAQVLVDLDEAGMAADYDSIDKSRDRDGRILNRLIDEERQRSIVGEELGEAIGLDNPESFCVADAIDFLPEPLAQQMTQLCQMIREQARGLRAQNRIGELLGMHAFDRVEVFLSPGAQIMVDPETDSTLPAAPKAPRTQDRFDPIN
jgi:hypothetical protein